jgi:hypothetical protein
MVDILVHYMLHSSFKKKWKAISWQKSEIRILQCFLIFRSFVFLKSSMNQKQKLTNGWLVLSNGFLQTVTQNVAY